MSEKNIKIQQTWKCGDCESELEFGNAFSYAEDGNDDKEGIVGVFACPDPECKTALVKVYRNKD
jgi:hypothetical protein